MNNQRSLGQLLGTGLMFGLAFGVFTGVTRHDVTAGLVTGVIGGVLFAIGIAIVTKLAAKQLRPIELGPGETVLHEGPANHWKGIEAVGGRLVLTNHKLRFSSHKMNVANHEQAVALDQIASIEPGRTMGVIPNAIVVHLRDGNTERFVVGGRASWVIRIREVI
ncbi:MAG: hypothetical protein JWO36_6501 [Myxococcales bacterium]|nr:hypothetical protein [Myxococcales bacterium]